MDMNMPSMPLLSDDNVPNQFSEQSDLSLDWSIEAVEHEAIIRDWYGPSGQNNASLQAEASPQKTTSDVNAETIEKLLMESKYLKQLSKNQATLLENYTKLTQNQEKLLQGHENFESMLKLILNEIRHGKRFNDENAKHEPSPKQKKNQKMNRDPESGNKTKAMVKEASYELESEKINDVITTEPKLFPKQTINKRRMRSSAGLSDTETDGISVNDTETRPKKSKTEMLLNTDKTLYFKNWMTKICIFCKKRYERIVAHYKTSHSLAEVVASRLSPNMIEEIRANHPKSVVAVKKNDRLMKAKCAFCEEEKAFTTTYWPNHIQSHTGEYRNKCNVCGLLLPYPSYHCKQKTRNIDEFRLDEKDFTVHLCLECNYVQIDQTNIIKHLRTQHKFNDDALESKYEIITMLSIKNDGSSLQHRTSIDQIQGHTADHVEVNKCRSEATINETSLGIDSNNFIVPAECTKYWRTQNAIKNDPSQNEHFLIIAEYYKQTPTHAFQVKRWIISDKWTKPILSKMSQFALFKCMHSQCVFSTNTRKDMEMHMDHHIAFIQVLQNNANNTLNKTIRDVQIKFRDCCYCDFNGNSNNQLLDHVVAEHDHCIYQCAYCFYRSIEVDNIVLHYEAYHPGEKPDIYLCGEVREFREQDKEMLQGDVEKIRKILCGQDNCQKEYGTFDDLQHHLDNKHPANTNYQCQFCDETISPKHIESHLNNYFFYEFECIYCQCFGDNNILEMRKHLSVEHPSKFSFVATRRHLSGVKSMAGFNILYIGDLIDQSAYKFIKLPDGSDLSCMDPSLHAYESHHSQQNVEFEEILFTEPLPPLTFSGTSSDFFIKYDLPYLCTAVDDATKVECNFQTNKEDDLHRHILKKHSQTQITYKTIESVSQVENVTKLVICEFECNMCHNLYKSREEISGHFRRMHPTNIFDSKIVQHMEVIESTDPKQPIQLKQTISNRLQFGGLFVNLKDGKYVNMKSQLITQHRYGPTPIKPLEFQIRTIIYDPSYFGWNAESLTQENEKFDRMIAYECYHCRNEHTSDHMLFESIETVQTHCKEEHVGKDVLYIPKKFFACAECSTVSTIDGIKEHYHQKHPNAIFTLVSPTSKVHCGVCNLCRFVKNNPNGLTAKKFLIGHFKNEHQIENGEHFDDRLLKKFGIMSDMNISQTSLECCKDKRFFLLKEVINHVFECSNVNGNVKLAFQRGDVKEFMKPFFNMSIYFKNGLTLQYKSIEKSTIGQTIKKGISEFSINMNVNN